MPEIVEKEFRILELTAEQRKAVAAFRMQLDAAFGFDESPLEKDENMGAITQETIKA